MVEDVDGNIFLDFNVGIAVCATGHCHPEVIRTVQEQVDFCLEVFEEALTETEK